MSTRILLIKLIFIKRVDSKESAASMALWTDAVVILKGKICELNIYIAS